MCVRYFCHDCNRQVPIEVTTEREPYEFWGDQGWTFDSICTCAMCGSYQVEEIFDEA